MIFLERVLSAFALAQTIVATLRSGSRALYILRSTAGDGSSPIGVMVGPLILPPVANSTDSSLLWEVSTSFRHSVELALNDGGNRNKVRVAPSSSAGNKDSNKDSDSDLSYFSDRVTSYINLPSVSHSDSKSKSKSSTTSVRRARISAYAPQCFANLRSRCFGITEESFRRSILLSGPFISFQSNSKGAARTGGVFCRPY
jgi:hypothetical protein